MDRSKQSGFPAPEAVPLPDDQELRIERDLERRGLIAQPEPHGSKDPDTTGHGDGGTGERDREAGP